MTESAAMIEHQQADSRAITEVGQAAAVAREEAEIKAAIFLARRYPRDELGAYARVIRTCKRPGFAETAMYAFTRAGQVVKGPSVDLAREIARQWGNIRYGMRVVAMDEETVHIRAYAHDLETNTYLEGEDRFARLIQRKEGGVTRWVRPDERELRELINRRGAILMRNCILQVVPSDLVDDAVRTVEETMREAAKGEIEQSREETIRRLAVAFAALGVTTEMLAARLGHPLETITAEEIAQLRGVYKSIVDGHSRISEHFDLNASRRAAATDELNARLQQTQQLVDAAPNGPAPASSQAPPRQGRAQARASAQEGLLP